VRVHLVHDGDRFHIAFESVENTEGELVTPEALIDPDDSRIEARSHDDWWFHVSAQDCDTRGYWPEDASIESPATWGEAVLSEGDEE